MCIPTLSLAKLWKLYMFMSAKVYTYIYYTRNVRTTCTNWYANMIFVVAGPFYGRHLTRKSLSF